MNLNINSQTIRFNSIDNLGSNDNRGIKYLHLISALLIHAVFYLNIMQKYIFLKN